MIDENLYWHMHVEHVYDSLVKYFGMSNHVKTMIFKRIARQMYFAATATATATTTNYY